MSDIGKSLDRILAVLNRISQVAVWVGGALLLASALLICAEIGLRRMGITTRGADEFSYYVLAISSSWAFSFTLLRKAHIRIDVIYARLGARVRGLLDMLALLALGLFAFIATYTVAFGLLTRSITRGSTSNTVWQTPLWIPQGIWWLGWVLFTITTSVLLLRVAWAFFVERDLKTVDRYAGGQTLEEEIEEALGEDELFAEGGAA